jgi:DNA-binding NarL/FixJ family response regulator
VAQGRQVLSPDIAQTLALSKLGRVNRELGELSVRELATPRTLCETHSPEDIASILHVSPKTVSNLP